MTYRFKLQEPIADGVRRIGLEQIDIAAAKLAGKKDDPAVAIHDARRCLKRLRALLRLVRPGVAETTYRRETDRLVEWARGRITLEHGLALGAILLLAGVVTLAAIFVAWALDGFGARATCMSGSRRWANWKPGSALSPLERPPKCASCWRKAASAAGAPARTPSARPCPA